MVRPREEMARSGVGPPDGVVDRPASASWVTGAEPGGAGSAEVGGRVGGSRAQAEAHLRRSLTYNANSTVSRFFLAELLFDLDRDAEAIEQLETLIAAPSDPDWEPEDRIYKERARRLLN